MGVAGQGRLDDPGGLRDLAQGGGVRHAGPDRVHRDPGVEPGHLHGELAAVGLQGRLGRRHRTVRRDHPGRSLGGHREDLGAAFEEARSPEVLDPVDERVGHHVERHLHLLAADGALRVLGEERLQGAEGERVHDDPQVRRPPGCPRLREALRETREGGGALLVVGRVHVDEDRLGPGRRDGRLDLLDMLEAGPEVQVDPEDPVARPGQGQPRGLSHAARCAENQRPALAVVRHRCLPRLPCAARPGPGRRRGSRRGRESTSGRPAAPRRAALHATQPIRLVLRR